MECTCIALFQINLITQSAVTLYVIFTQGKLHMFFIGRVWKIGQNSKNEEWCMNNMCWMELYILSILTHALLFKSLVWENIFRQTFIISPFLPESVNVVG